MHGNVRLLSSTSPGFKKDKNCYSSLIPNHHSHQTLVSIFNSGHMQNHNGLFINVRNFTLSTVVFQSADNMEKSTTESNEVVIKSESISPNAVNTDIGGATVSENVVPEYIAGVESKTVLDTSPDVDSKELVLDFLPDKPTPTILNSLDPTPTTMHYVGDPPFDALGLASYWPPGRMQWFMEHIHLDLDLPWWATIAVSKINLVLYFIKATMYVNTCYKERDLHFCFHDLQRP